MTEAQEIAARLSEAQRRALLALPTDEGARLTCAEMRPVTNGAALDSLYMRYGAWRRRALCARHWTRWGGEPGQKRGEGYEYEILPLGLEVRRILTEKPE